MILDLRNTCPFCSGGQSQELFLKNDVPILKCQDCSHRYCLTSSEVSDRVADEFDDDYFFGGKLCYDDYSVMRPDLKRKSAYYSKILKRNLNEEARNKPKILDVGCAAGYLLEGFVEQGWGTTGLEANRTMAKYAREELGLDVHHCPIEDFESESSYDVASLVQVLPHITEPYKALSQIHDKLNPDGLLLIETWNCDSLAARVFGTNWHQYNPPSVLHWFSRSSLGRLLRKHKFEVVKQGRPVKWIHVGNGAAIFKKSLGESAFKICITSVLDRVPSSLKVPYFLDDVFWVVARKCD